MNLAPFLSAPAIIQLHTAAAVSALLLGAVQFWLPKGKWLHRVMGWTWAALMLIVAISSIWISKERFQLGPFSPIHLFAILTLVTLPLGILYARRRNVKAHKTTMIALYAGALIIAGLFTLLPSRILGRMLFS